MGWKDLSYTKKGLIIGAIITFILIMIPSYSAPNQNYNLAKKQYEGYNTIIQNCGNNPADECVKSLCANKDPYDGFCEGVTRQGSEYDPGWRAYIRTEKPNIFVLLIPNIKDGLELFAMFGLIGLSILIAPFTLGLLIGKIIDKIKYK